MIFEDALKLLREGKKITHPYLNDDEYFMRCFMWIPRDGSIPPIMGINGEFLEPKPNPEDLILSIVKMEGDYKHPDMIPNKIDWSIPDFTSVPIKPPPSIPITVLMSDDWKEYLK